MAKLIEWPIYI